MKSLGWYADGYRELAMNVGTWFMFMAVGWFVLEKAAAVGFFMVGSLLGVGGQILYYFNEREQPGSETV